MILNGAGGRSRTDDLLITNYTMSRSYLLLMIPFILRITRFNCYLNGKDFLMFRYAYLMSTIQKLYNRQMKILTVQFL